MLKNVWYVKRWVQVVGGGQGEGRDQGEGEAPEMERRNIRNGE